MAEDVAGQAFGVQLLLLPPLILVILFLPYPRKRIADGPKRDWSMHCSAGGVLAASDHSTQSS
jgi:hypothetical protein